MFGYLFIVAMLLVPWFNDHVAPTQPIDSPEE